MADYAGMRLGRASPYVSSSTWSSAAIAKDGVVYTTLSGSGPSTTWSRAVHPRDRALVVHHRGHGRGVPAMPCECFRSRRRRTDRQEPRPWRLVVPMEGVHAGGVLVQRRRLSFTAISPATIVRCPGLVLGELPSVRSPPCAVARSIVLVHLVAVWLVFKIARHLDRRIDVRLCSPRALRTHSEFMLGTVVWMAACGIVLGTTFGLATFYVLIGVAATVPHATGWLASHCTQARYCLMKARSRFRRSSRATRFCCDDDSAQMTGRTCRYGCVHVEPIIWQAPFAFELFSTWYADTGARVLRQEPQ